MNQDLKIIKKKYGENMSKLCRVLFPTLLETEGLLPKLLLDNFEPDHSLCEDLIAQETENEFKNYIYNLVDVENNNEIKVNKTPKELLGEAGYDLYECKTEEDIQSFKKYYAENEELCTFNGGRLDSSIVFFAVKKDVDNIKREDYKNPKRQDLYGTSVISIQFKKDESHTLSIKNRYNHRVNNPDSTFSNNLDNIIPGLTKSFEDNYGLVQSHKSKNFEIPSYVKAQDGKYYKYNYEINNIYYCTNNIIIDNYEVKKYPKDRYLVFDYLILDLKNKQIYLYDRDCKEAFINNINDIEKIEITKQETEKLLKIKCLNQEDIEITLNKDNKMIKLFDPNIELVGNNFLKYNEALEMVDFPKLQKVGTNFLEYNEILQVINCPNLRKTGNWALYFNRALQSISLPNLEETGHHFLYFNRCIQTIDFPKLKKVDRDFMDKNEFLQVADFPALEIAGDNFLEKNEILHTINCPNLQKVDDYFLRYNECLKVVDFPNLKETGKNFIKRNKSLQVINCPNLQKVKDNFLYYNENLQVLDFPNLEMIGKYFLMHNMSLQEFNCPKIDMSKVEYDFMQSHPTFNGINMKNTRRSR